MHHLYLSQPLKERSGTTTVTTYDQTIKYFVSGQIGHRHNKLTIFNEGYEPLATITQISGGLLPRFILSKHDKQVGSFGISLKRHELLYINTLNWFVLGRLEKRHFQISTVNHQLANAYPLADKRLEVTLTNHDQEDLLVLIIAFLDRWLFIAHRYPLTWPNLFNTPSPLVTPFSRSKPSNLK